MNQDGPSLIIEAPFLMLHDNKHPNYNPLFKILGNNLKWPPMNQDGGHKVPTTFFLNNTMYFFYKKRLAIYI